MDSSTKLIGNKLLAGVPTEVFRQFASKLEVHQFSLGETIYSPGAEIENVYFPQSGIISFLSAIEKRSTLETGAVGNEGMIGLSAFLGLRNSPNHAVVRAVGTAWKMDTDDFLAACADSFELTKLVHRYAHLLLTQLSLVGACNRFHTVAERLTCWLLMTGDRLESEQFQMTHQFISDMLGVRREAVALAAARLQAKHLIAYNRGKLSIVNRKGLEQASCRCYGIMKAEQENYIK